MRELIRIIEMREINGDASHLKTKWRCPDKPVPGAPVTIMPRFVGSLEAS